MLAGAAGDCRAWSLCPRVTARPVWLCFLSPLQTSKVAAPRKESRLPVFLKLLSCCQWGLIVRFGDPCERLAPLGWPSLLTVPPMRVCLQSSCPSPSQEQQPGSRALGPPSGSASKVTASPPGAAGGLWPGSSCPPTERWLRNTAQSSSECAQWPRLNQGDRDRRQGRGEDWARPRGVDHSSFPHVQSRGCHWGAWLVWEGL